MKFVQSVVSLIGSLWAELAVIRISLASRHKLLLLCSWVLVCSLCIWFWSSDTHFFKKSMHLLHEDSVVCSPCTSWIISWVCRVQQKLLLMTVPLMSNKGYKWEFRTPDLKSSSDMNDGVSRVPDTLILSSSSSISSPSFVFLSWMCERGLGSTFLFVPLFHLAISSVQAIPVKLFLTACSNFHSRAPMWLQECPCPAMHEHQPLTTVPSCLQWTYTSLALVTVYEDRTSAFNIMSLSS